jgi:hypothetical protein
MTAAIDLDVKLCDAHTPDGFPCPRPHCLVGSKLFGLAGCDVGPETQITHPCPGFLLSCPGGAMPGQDSCYEHYLQQRPQGPRPNFLLRSFATELLYITLPLSKSQPKVLEAIVLPEVEITSPRVTVMYI